MPNRSRKPKRPTDPNELAHVIGQIATGEAPPDEKPTEETAESPEEAMHAAAVALGRRGGLKGGKARAEKLSQKRITEIAKKAAKARWAKKR